MEKFWFRVTYMEVRSDGLEQEQGYDDVVAENATMAIELVRHDCNMAGAKTHDYKAIKLDDAAPYRGVRPIGY